MDKKSKISTFLNTYKPKNPGSLIAKFKQKTRSSSGSTNTGFYETLVINKPPDNKQQSNKDNEVCKKITNVNSLIKRKYMIPSQFPNITQQHNETITRI
jgi:hypothetical protein